jgi:hypothetical protein
MFCFVFILILMNKGYTNLKKNKKVYIKGILSFDYKLCGSYLY